MKYLKTYEYLKINTFVVLKRVHDGEILLIRISNMSGYAEIIQPLVEWPSRFMKFRQEPGVIGQLNFYDEYYNNYDILYTTKNIEKAKEQYNFYITTNKYNL